MKDHPRSIYDKILSMGETAIDEFIEERATETLFIDFKRSSTNGDGKRLDANDRNNFAKAISGFGNSEGGILVWGVDCREGEDFADVAKAKHPLIDAQRFASWLEGAVSSVTVPPHSGVVNTAILSGKEMEGYAVTYIPKSNDAPHQVISTGKSQYRYYIRAGSDFVPTPHAVLAGMFGRRPQPSIFHMFSSGPPVAINRSQTMLQIDLGILVANGGRGIARDIFMTITTTSTPGPNCRISISRPDTHVWNYWDFLTVKHTAASKVDIRLPPQAQLQPFSLTMILAPPFNGELNIEGICGCLDAPSFNFKINNSASNFEKLFTNYLQEYANRSESVSDKWKYSYDFWNLKEESERMEKIYSSST